MNVFSRVLKFEEKQLHLLAVLGPLFLITSLFISFIGTNNHNADLLGFIIASVFLCVRYKKSGLYFSLILLLFLICVRHFFISSNHLWHFGLELSFAFGVAITYLSFEHIENFLHSRKEDNQDLLQNITDLEADLKKEQDVYQSNLMVLQQEIDNMQKKVIAKEDDVLSLKNLSAALQTNQDQNKQVKETLLKEVFQHKKEKYHLIDDLNELKSFSEKLKDQQRLYDNNKILLNELNEARKEKQQTHYINEAMAKILDKEIKKREEKILLEQKKSSEIERKNIDLESRLIESKNLLRQVEEKLILNESKLEESLAKVSKPQVKIIEKVSVERPSDTNDYIKSLETKSKKAIALHQQLKNQFEERRKMLSRTRKELFHANEKLTAISRKTDLDAFNISTNERKYLHSLLFMEKECKALEDENKSLSEIITKLV
jgi:hypothetical protein